MKHLEYKYFSIYSIHASLNNYYRLHTCQTVVLLFIFNTVTFTFQNSFTGWVWHCTA